MNRFGVDQAGHGQLGSLGNGQRSVVHDKEHLDIRVALQGHVAAEHRQRLAVNGFAHILRQGTQEKTVAAVVH